MLIVFYFLLYREMADVVRYRPRSPTWDSPYTKTFLLLQAHFSRLSLPNSDYLTDTKSALDNATRVMQVCIKRKVDDKNLAMEKSYR